MVAYSTLKRVSVSALVVVALGVTALTCAIALFSPKAPPALAAVENAGSHFGAIRDLPSVRYYTARDGTKLAYRAYPGIAGKGVIVMLHGSTGNSAVMHLLAGAFQARGHTVYALDLRGHGDNKPLGEVSYPGQLTDDLHDFSSYLQKWNPGERTLLLGHSSGGSLTLKFAALGNAGDFDAYLALSPYISSNGLLARPQTGGWTSVAIPRIVALTILNRFGIHSFDDLPVIAFAVAKNAGPDRARVYSHAMLASINLPYRWQPALKAIRAPTRILIGSEDELFFADRYPSQIGAVNPEIDVKLVPGVGHMAMVYDSKAIAAALSQAEALLASLAHGGM